MNLFEMTIVRYAISSYFAWLTLMVLMNLSMCLWALGWHGNESSKLNLII